MRSSTLLSLTRAPVISITVGMLPRRSSSVCSFTAALLFVQGAHGNKERHKSIVVEQSINRVLQFDAKLILRVEQARLPNENLSQIGIDAPVSFFVGMRQIV